MVVSVATNIGAIQTQRRLNENTQAMSRVFERLSSGQRINRASDDAAGLAISQSLKTDRSVFRQGIRNLNDGVSLLNIADGTLAELSNVVIRIRELAEQSANGTFSPQQRKALDREAQTLSDEFARISKATKFNGLNLFDGSISDLRLQGEYGTNGGIQSGLGGALGTGTFGAATSYVGTGLNAYDSALGDINGDGILDLVTVGLSTVVTGEALIRLGVGDGTFGSARTYSTEAFSSHAVAFGDVNGDGNLDLVTAGTTVTADGYSTVRLGRGDGTFGSATSYTTESWRSNAVTLADLNSDGVLDLATAGVADGGAGGYATIRLGRGDGTFGSAVSYTTETTRSHAIVIGDLNGDQILDLITAGTATGTDGYATVRLGTGNGTFSGATSFGAEQAESYGVALGDLNGDSILDLVTAGTNDLGGSTVSTRFGNGNGTFLTRVSYAVGGQLDAVALGDLNGDGRLDILSGGTTFVAGFVNILMGSATGSYGASTSYTYGTEQLLTHDISLGDLNGDGVLDLVTAGETFASAGYATVRVASTVSGVNPLLPFSLGTLADSRQAMGILDRKLEQLAYQRGTIGAFQSRIATAVSNLSSSAENYALAESRIRDADIASEAAEGTRLQILQQASASVLSQANQQPLIALQLLST